MTMYALITNGEVEKYPYSIGLLRKDNPNTSFPKTPKDAILVDYGVYPVMETNPTVGADQKLVKSWTPELVSGEWVLNHQAVDMTSEDVAERDGVIASNVREKRNTLLAATDYFALSDVTLTTEMTEYRAALRNFTEHDNWPNVSDNDWPTKPS